MASADLVLKMKFLPFSFFFIVRLPFVIFALTVIFCAFSCNSLIIVFFLFFSFMTFIFIIVLSSNFKFYYCCFGFYILLC